MDNSTDYLGTGRSMLDDIQNFYQEQESEKIRKWIEIIVILMIFGVGIIGNILVIFVIVILKEYKKIVTHWYVLQLALADGMFLCTLPFKVIEFVNEAWIFSSAACTAKETLLFWNYYASVIFLAVMSYERYTVICRYTNNAAIQRSLSNAIVTSGVVWVASFICCTPIIMYSGKMGITPYCRCGYAFPVEAVSKEEFCLKEGFVSKEQLEFCKSLAPDFNKKPVCRSLDMEPGSALGLLDYSDYVLQIFNSSDSYYDMYDMDKMETEMISSACHYWDKGHTWNAFLIFNFVVMFLAPLSVMTVCYFCIVRKLRQEQRSKQTISNVSTSSENQRIAVLCGVLVFVFVVCWLPFHAVHLARMAGINLAIKDEFWCIILPAVASVIAYSNSALNPYLYNFLGTKFYVRLRSAAKSVFQLRKLLGKLSDNKSQASRISLSKSIETTIVNMD